MSKKQECASPEIALKSLFLGPQSENAEWFLLKIVETMQHTFEWRRTRFPADGVAITLKDQQDLGFKNMQCQLSKALHLLLRELENETPKFTPRYIGHMVSELSLPSLLAELAMLLHNPNNASSEASKVGLRIEREAIQDLATMIGFDAAASRGHFTSGGTIANFEAIWRAIYHIDKRCSLALKMISQGDAKPQNFFSLSHRFDQFLPHEEPFKENSFLHTGPWSYPASEILGFKFEGPVLIVPSSKHYSWPKAASLFGLGAQALWQVPLNEDGRMDVMALRGLIHHAETQQRPIVAVVSVAGTTELGEVDDIGAVQDVLDEYANRGLHIWHHVDAAYGGFLCSIKEPSASFSDRTVAALTAISRADSVTLDPHKLGYVPYACGAIVVKNEFLYQCHKMVAPYLQQSPVSTANWSTTIEGSRSAVGAAAVWLTSRTLPFSDIGFGRILRKTIEAREVFAKSLAQVPSIKIATPSDTNIVCFAVVKPGDSIAETDRRTRMLYEAIEQGPDFSVSRTTLCRSNYGKLIRRLCREWEIEDDGTSDLFLIRLVLMNPFIVSKEMNTNFESAFKSTVVKCLSDLSD